MSCHGLEHDSKYRQIPLCIGCVISISIMAAISPLPELVSFDSTVTQFQLKYEPVDNS